MMAGLAYQKIAGMLLTTTGEVQLFEAPLNTEIKGEVIVCNTGAVNATCSMAWCDRGHGDNAADVKDWIIKGVAVVAGNDSVRIPVCLGAGESLRVQASVADVLAVTLGGVKKVD